MTRLNDTDSANLSADVVGEACAWIAQLETGDLTTADLEAFREWIRRSPYHASEINRLARLSADLNVLSALAQPLQEAAAHYAPILKRRQSARESRFNRWAGTVAAFSIALATLIAVVHVSKDAHAPEGSIVLATPIGGLLEKKLADGSVVTLNTDTLLTVDYQPNQRVIRLQRGEALFQVAHNTERPFLVFSKGRVVRAVGTAFVVRVDQTNLRVTVTEGRVALEEERLQPVAGQQVSDASVDNVAESSAGRQKSESPKIPAPIMLDAGESVRVESGERAQQVVSVSDAALDHQLAWQRGLFEFSNTPLEEVVAEVNRYTTYTIEIDDPELRALQFGGVFPTGDPQPLFEALETAYGVSIERVGGSTIHLAFTQ